MKNSLILGVLVLAFGTSALAKSPTKINDVKTVEQKNVTKKRSSCSGGMTSCGSTYMVCDDGGLWTAEENLELWDFMDFFLCN